MPPHCDAMDGPVVKAAKAALEAGDVTLVLPYVPREGEEEVNSAFEKCSIARTEGAEAREVADEYFYETVVRVHRAGEGAAFTGLKPAGLSHGPVIAVAEKAIATESPDELLKLMSDMVQREVRMRFNKVMELKGRDFEGVVEAREYVSAMLGLEVYSHKLYKCAMSDISHHG